MVSLKSLVLSMLIVVDSKASPILQSIEARTTGITSPDEDLMTVKNILEWFFSAAALVVVCSVFLWRIQFLRARNRPLRDFFTFIEAPHQREGLSAWSTRPTPIPLGRQRVARTYATDVDSEGRRLGGPDPDDVNGDVTEKDVLPAYEVKGGPPNYSQFLAVNPGTDTNTGLQITGTASVETSSQTANSSTQPSPGLHLQLPAPPLPSYNPVSATTRPTMPPTNP